MNATGIFDYEGVDKEKLDQFTEPSTSIDSKGVGKIDMSHACRILNCSCRWVFSRFPNYSVRKSNSRLYMRNERLQIPKPACRRCGFRFAFCPECGWHFRLIHNSNGIMNWGMFASYGNCIVKVKRLGGSHRRSISLPANEHRGDRIALDYKRPLPCL